jgi:hypothetical protein
LTYSVTRISSTSRQHLEDHCALDRLSAYRSNLGRKYQQSARLHPRALLLALALYLAPTQLHALALSLTVTPPSPVLHLASQDHQLLLLQDRQVKDRLRQFILHLSGLSRVLLGKMAPIRLKLVTKRRRRQRGVQPISGVRSIIQGSRDSPDL